MKLSRRTRHSAKKIAIAEERNEELPSSDKAEMGVTVITATNRPGFMDNLIRNFQRQQWTVKEIIVLLNNDSMKIERYKKHVGTLGKVSVYKLPANWSLGKCLNYGIRKAKYEVIAKFDDDDYYSPYYLSEAMLKLEKSDADLIGKNRFFMYFKHSANLVLATMPSKRRAAGATMLFKKKLYPDVSFKNLHKGSDMRFQKDSMKKGYKLAFTSPYYFAAIRRANQKTHTWKVTDKTIRLLRVKKVAKTNKFRNLVIPPGKQKKG